MTEFHPAFSNTTGSSSLRWFIAILLNTEIGVKGETVVFERAPDLSRMQTRSHEAKMSAYATKDDLWPSPLEKNEIVF